jgi:hypothetical protein
LELPALARRVLGVHDHRAELVDPEQVAVGAHPGLLDSTGPRSLSLMRAAITSMTGAATSRARPDAAGRGPFDDELAVGRAHGST